MTEALSTNVPETSARSSTQAISPVTVSSGISVQSKGSNNGIKENGSSMKKLNDFLDQSFKELTTMSKKKLKPLPENSVSSINFDKPISKKIVNYDSTNFFKRMNDYEFCRQALIKMNEEKLEKSEMKECSFAPKIISQSFKPKESVYKRLMKKNDNTDKLKLMKEAEDLIAFNKDCTFHPTVNNKTTLKNMNATCFGEAKRLSFSKIGPEQRHRGESFTKFVCTNHGKDEIYYGAKKERKILPKSASKKDNIQAVDNRASGDMISPVTVKFNRNQAIKGCKTTVVKKPFPIEKGNSDFDFEKMKKHFELINKSQNIVDKFYKEVGNLKESNQIPLYSSKTRQTLQ